MHNRIRNIRENKNLKQHELARILNITQSTYSKYERGIIQIPIDSLIKIADYYVVTLDYLVGRVKNKSDTII